MRRLKCPYCDGNLKSGQARIHGTVAGLFLIGLSYQNLYFKPESEKEIKILGSNNSTPSMRCEKCGVVILNLDFPEQCERDVLIELLTLCSSKELRESIQESNPDVNINNEIIKTWKDNYSPHDNEFKESFTNDELCMLEDFDKLINANNWEVIETLSEKIIEKLNNN